MAEIPEVMVLPKVSVNVVYPDGPQKWEYKYIPLASIETLNALGAIGWQVVLFLPPDGSFLLIRQIMTEPGEEADRILD